MHCSNLLKFGNDGYWMILEKRKREKVLKIRERKLIDNFVIMDNYIAVLLSY